MPLCELFVELDLHAEQCRKCLYGLYAAHERAGDDPLGAIGGQEPRQGIRAFSSRFGQWTEVIVALPAGWVSRMGVAYQQQDHVVIMPYSDRSGLQQGAYRR